MRRGRHIMSCLVVAISVFAGCAGDSLTASGTKRIHRACLEYKETESYAALRQVSQDGLGKGMTKQEVGALIGEGVEPWVGDPDTTRMYCTNRSEPWGHTLLLHYRSDRLEDWEWVSE